MKKFFLIAMIVLPALCSGQTDNNPQAPNSFFPEPGNWAIGTSASPFFAFAGNLFSSDYTAVPYFTSTNPGSIFLKKQLTENKSLRVDAMFGISSNTDKSGNATDPDQYDNYITNAMSFSLTAGIEKYKGLHKRIRGYYGADAGVFKDAYNGYAYQSFTNISGKASYKDALNVLNNFKETGGNQYGIQVRGFIGFEYFILPKIAISGEFGFGAQAVYTTDRIYKPETGAEVVFDPKGFDAGIDTNSSSNINLFIYF